MEVCCCSFTIQYSGKEVRKTILRPIKEDERSERSVKVIRKVYIQVQADTKYTYSTATFYDQIKTPLSEVDIQSTTQPQSLISCNKEQLQRVVDESPWRSEITSVATYEQLKNETEKLNNQEKADLTNFLFDKIDWSN